MSTIPPHQRLAQCEQLFGKLLDTGPSNKKERDDLAGQILELSKDMESIQRAQVNNLLLQVLSQHEITELQAQAGDLQVQIDRLEGLMETAKEIDDVTTRAQVSAQEGKTSELETADVVLEVTSSKLEAKLGMLSTCKGIKTVAERTLEAIAGKKGSLREDLQTMARGRTRRSAELLKTWSQGVSRPTLRGKKALALPKKISDQDLISSFSGGQRKILEYAHALAESRGSSLTEEVFGSGQELMTVLTGKASCTWDEGRAALAQLKDTIGFAGDLNALGLEVGKLRDQLTQRAFVEATPFFLERHAAEVAPSARSGLPNRSVDCFMNAMTQVMGKDMMVYFDPAKNPITLAKVKALPAGHPLRRATGAGRNHAKLQKDLQKIQTSMFTMMQKCEKREEVSAREVGHLRALLTGMGLISVGDREQEDSALLVGRVLDCVVGFTDKAGEAASGCSIVRNFTLDDAGVECVGAPIDLPQGVTPEMAFGDGVVCAQMGSNTAGTAVYCFSNEEFPKGMIALTPAGAASGSLSTREEVPLEGAMRTRYIKLPNGKYQKLLLKKVQQEQKVSNPGKVIHVNVTRRAGEVVDPPAREVTVGGKRFVLRASITHRGGTGGGHYVASAFVPNESGEKGRWHVFNDAIAYACGAEESMRKAPPVPSGPGLGGDDFAPAQLFPHATYLQYVEVT